MDNLVKKNFDGSIHRPSFTSLGKADCVLYYFSNRPLLSRHWGGTENDFLFDVASDSVSGNVTIFLRAGSEFGITSATQSLVPMKLGYNIVKLDTNALLTSTFPVTLEAPQEISDTQIALGKGNTVFILAKDESRKQYFISKVSPSGTAWTRYLDATTAGAGTAMRFIVDSKENIYITGNFAQSADFGNGTPLIGGGITAYVASYTTNNVFRGAMNLGNGAGETIRLSPQEDAIYINGWAFGNILGMDVPGSNSPYYKVRGFLVKLKL